MGAPETPNASQPVNQPSISSLELQAKESELQAAFLRVEELQLKIRDLRRPEYRRTTFWLSVAAAMIALLGVVAQGTLSSVKSERAELKIQQAAIITKESDEKRLLAEEQKEAANRATDKALERRDEALAAQERVWDRLSAARPFVDEIEGRIQHLSALVKDGAAASAIQPQVLRLEKAVQAARSNLYYISLTFEDAAVRHEKPDRRPVTVSSDHKALSVYILTDKDWQSLRGQGSLSSVLNDGDTLQKLAVIAGETPIRTQLTVGGRYAFVIHGSDRYLVELITIPPLHVPDGGANNAQNQP